MLDHEGLSLLTPETSCHDDVVVVASLLLAAVAVCDRELVGPIVAGTDFECDMPRPG